MIDDTAASPGSDELVGMLLAFACDLAYRWDLERGTLDWVGDGVPSLYGLERDALLAMSFDELVGIVHPDDLPGLIASHEQVAASPGAAGLAEYRMRVVSGGYRWITDRYHVVRDASGALRYRVGVVADVTARMAGTEALLESEAKYHSVVESMAEGVVLQRTDGVIAACNARAEEILGLSQDQLMGRTSIDPRWRAVHEDGSPFPGSEHPAMVTLRTAEPLRDVLMGIHKPDDDLHWISINTMPVLDGANGAMTGVVATFVDVTERRAMEDELRDSEERYQALFENTLTLICIFEPESLEFVDVNGAFETTYGYTRMELLRGMTILDVSVEQDMSSQASSRIVHEGTHYIPLRWHRKKSGEIFPVEMVGGTFEVNGRKLVFAMGQDITHRVNAEEALRTSEEWFRRHFQESKDALVIEDDGGIISVNPSALELFGCGAASDMVGRPLFMFSPPVQPDGTNSALAARRRRELAYTVGSEALQWVHQRPDGSTFAADLLLSRVSLAGRPVLAITVRDVTERQRAERSLREREERFRLLAAEHERLLARSSEYAAARDRLLHEVNHRVKNNLSSIMGLMELELAHGHEGAGEAPAWLSRLENLRGRVRSLAVAHSYLSASEWAPVALTELAAKVIDAGRSMLHGMQVMGVSIRPSTIQVSSRQASALALIVNELVTNSIKHGRRPSMDLRVSVDVTRESHEICMVFRDNGPGFPEEVLRGARSSVGISVVQMMAEHDLHGAVDLLNDSGAVVRIRLAAAQGVGA